MSTRSRTSTREPPYPTVIMVPPVAPAESQSWLKKFGTALTIIGTLTTIGVVVVGVARWSRDIDLALRNNPASAQQVDVSMGRARTERSMPTDSTSTDNALEDPSGSVGAAPSSSRGMSSEVDSSNNSEAATSQPRAQDGVVRNGERPQSTGFHPVDLAETTLSNEGDFVEDCVRRPNGFVLRVRTRNGVGNGAFAGCCLTFESPQLVRRASVKIESAYRESLLHAKFENGSMQEYLHNGGWTGSGRIEGVLQTLRARGAAKFCVMAVGSNSPVQNEIAVTDLQIQ